MKLTPYMQSQLIEVIVEYEGGEYEPRHFRTRQEAMTFINDEIQWESCICCRLGNEVFDGFFNFTEVGKC